MPVYKKESLESLRQKVDLVEVLSSHIELKRAGGSYKALCPFHDEKTPSFTIQKGDTHYHCFGCGAHGDAIAFLMGHVKMSFSDAVESLAQRFHVPLEIADQQEKKGPDKRLLKEALDGAQKIYHFMLLHSAEGQAALHYLYQRGLDLDFIRHFSVGFAPPYPGFLSRILHTKGISNEILAECGLLALGKDGRWRDFFSDRITFPICDPTGAVIGFSARKFKEETFGGKYINTPETTLFKKSRVLFGLHLSRKRIAKERRAIVVEGQVDALRLIQEGFNITVAGQGTAFGEGHAKELLNLGVNLVYLALDNDQAGQEAAAKIGDLFQKEGVEVRIVTFPKGEDPDSFLRQNGAVGFSKLLEKGEEYLPFLVRHYGQSVQSETPAGKNELIQRIVAQIRKWDHPLMVHESLRKLASMMRVPEDVIGVAQEHMPNIYVKKSASIGLQNVDPDRILESDFLRWLLLAGEGQEKLVKLARLNITPEDLRVTVCRHLYLTYLECCDTASPRDLLAFTIRLDSAEAQLVLSEILQKKVNLEQAESQLLETIKRILDRNWMQRREEIRMRIQGGQLSEEETLHLVKSFEELRKCAPKVALEEDQEKLEVMT